MLDTKTMLVFLALGNLTIFLNLCFLLRRNRNETGDSFWYWSKLLQACGWLLLFLRGTIPFGVSFLAGNIFLLSGFWLETSALRLKGGALENRSLTKAGIAAIVAVVLYLYLAKVGPAISVAVLSMLSSMMYAYAGYEISKGWRKAGALRRFLAVTTLGVSWLVQFRVVAAIVAPFGLLSNNCYQTLVLLAWYVLMIAVSLGFILMERERADKADKLF